MGGSWETHEQYVAASISWMCFLWVSIESEPYYLGSMLGSLMIGNSRVKQWHAGLLFGVWAIVYILLGILCQRVLDGTLKSDPNLGSLHNPKKPLK